MSARRGPELLAKTFRKKKRNYWRKTKESIESELHALRKEVLERRPDADDLDYDLLRHTRSPSETLSGDPTSPITSCQRPQSRRKAYHPASPASWCALLEACMIKAVFPLRAIWAVFQEAGIEAGLVEIWRKLDEDTRLLCVVHRNRNKVECCLYLALTMLYRDQNVPGYGAQSGQRQEEARLCLHEQSVARYENVSQTTLC